MKNLILIITLSLTATLGFAQTKLNAGIGYYGHNATSPGAVLEFEIEKFYTKDFSLPLRADVGFFMTADYNALTIDIHKGFRKYLKSGFFFEQSVGIGMTASFFKIESIWYYDQYLSVVRYKDGANWGFTPSVTIGAGYNLTPDKEHQNLIWIRPKIYWNFGIRGLNLPYAALQVGFTHNFKTK